MTWPAPAVDFVQAIADTKLLLGHRYAQWLLGGPSLEDNMGGASTAQEELGHVRQLFRLLEQHGRDAAWLEGDRDPAAFHNAASLDTPWDDWRAFMCAAGPTDRAAWYLLEAIDHGDFDGLIEKIGEDEYFHLEYHDARLATLIDDAPSIVQATVDAALPAVLAFIGPPAYDDNNDPLLETGFTDRSIADIHHAFLEHYDDLFAGTDVSLESIDRAWPPPEPWDHSRRRVDGDGIDAGVIAELTGERNRLFRIE